MVPLIILVTVTVAARAAGALLGGDYLSSWPAATAVGLAAMFIVTGASHFVPARRAGFIAIVPPALTHPAALVTTTGVLELSGAAGLLIPIAEGALRTGAAWGLAALLVAMFPANVYASRSRRSANSPHTPLARRTAMQCVFVAAALFVALGS